ncbi:permease-like cell division protein FtsX [Neisseria sp. Ec49-e6-T10]|uniref:permease-like cell division protein FtsX n=1 Tax=Neisseria sp. Ec49-e6-T10 TaxID=3140744 RepID=UPI003EB7AA77
MKHIIFLNFLSAKTALINLIKQPFGSLLTLFMLAIAITLPLTLYLSIQNSEPLLGKFNEAPQITVFMELSADEVDAAAIEKNLQGHPDIAQVEFVPKNKALKDLQERMGETDLINLVDENPLPDAFIVTPKNGSPEALKNLQNSLQGLPMIELVQVDTEWAKTLFNIMQAIKKLTLFLGITLSVAFVLVAHNTIRLQILAKKEEIEITKLLGAPSSFIRRPFLYQAFWQGIFSCCLSLALCAWITKEAEPLFNNVLIQYGMSLNSRFFTPIEMGVIFLIIIALALAGAYLATREFLKALQAKA